MVKMRMLLPGDMKIIPNMISDFSSPSREELIGLDADGTQMIQMCPMLGELLLTQISKFVIHLRL